MFVYGNFVLGEAALLAEGLLISSELMEETGEDIRVVRRVLVLPAIDGGVGVERGAGVLGGLHDSIWGDIDVNFYGIKMRRDFYAQMQGGANRREVPPPADGSQAGFYWPYFGLS